MTNEEFNNIDVMKDNEEIIFYNNLFKSLSQNIEEKDQILIEPLFKSYAIDEQEINDINKRNKLERKKSKKLEVLDPINLAKKRKIEMRLYNDEIIKKFGNN